MRRIVQRLLIGALACSALALVPRPAAAHRLNVFAYVEGGDVVVETYFSDGKKARGADIDARHADGTLVASGTTADDGTFRFAVPTTPGALRVVASTGDGHRGEYEMAAEELGGVAAAGEGAGSIAERPPLDGDLEPAAGADATSDGIAVRLDGIESTLRNVQRELAELRKPQAGPSLERVLTGLGFIIGLTGAALFVAAVHKTRKAGLSSGGRAARSSSDPAADTE